MRFMDTLEILRVHNNAVCKLLRCVHTISSLNDAFYVKTSYIKSANKATCIIIIRVHTISSLNYVFYRKTSYIEGAK